MSATFRVVPTLDVRPNKRNVRENLGDLTELAASLRANGMQQPIIVTDLGDHFGLIDGHRRHAAAKIAGVKAIPAIVTDISGTRPTLVAMLAAAMHKQLTPLEQSKAFAALMDDGMPIGQIVQATGYSRATINARVSLLDLPDECQEMVADGTLGLGEAVTLAKQVKAKHAGSAATHSMRSAWLTASHPLAATVQNVCDHGHSRTLVGSVGCGQCWERIIRADALGEVAEYVPSFDEVAVLRAVEGGKWRGGAMARADRLEAVRRLVALGHDDSTIAQRTGVTARQVLRDRQALDLPAAMERAS